MAGLAFLKQWRRRWINFVNRKRLTDDADGRAAVSGSVYRSIFCASFALSNEN